MSERFRVAAVDDIPAGSCKELTVKDRVVALFNVDGQFYALDGVCTHAGGPLGEGTLNGKIVTCPWHGWQYDVTTGQHCLNANIQHSTFTTLVEGNDVFIEIPS